MTDREDGSARPKLRLTREELIGALKFNAIKYLARAHLKGATQQDHEKAAWYANYLANEMREP